MKPKKPAPELDSTKVLDLTVAGVRVRVRVDSAGRPLTAVAGLPGGRGSAEEQLAVLAAHDALEVMRQRAQRGRRRQSSADAAAESARKRAAASIKHWSNEWLAAAHAAHPSCGKDRLATAARKLARAGGIEPGTKRDEISEKRARQFLDRERNKKKSGP